MGPPSGASTRALFLGQKVQRVAHDARQQKARHQARPDLRVCVVGHVCFLGGARGLCETRVLTGGGVWVLWRERERNKKIMPAGRARRRRRRAAAKSGSPKKFFVGFFGGFGGGSEV